MCLAQCEASKGTEQQGHNTCRGLPEAQRNKPITFSALFGTYWTPTTSQNTACHGHTENIQPTADPQPTMNHTCPEKRQGFILKMTFCQSVLSIAMAILWIISTCGNPDSGECALKDTAMLWTKTKKGKKLKHVYILTWTWFAFSNNEKWLSLWNQASTLTWQEIIEVIYQQVLPFFFF